MIQQIKKTALRDGYYYSGYALQHYCIISENQPMIVGMWDSSTNCFWFWDHDDIKKTKRKMRLIGDIESMNEIEEGFVPVKEIIPKQEHIIE